MKSDVKKLHYVPILLSLFLSACGSIQNPPTPTPTVTPSPTPEPTATPIPIPSNKYLEPGDYVDNLLVGTSVRWFTVHIPPDYVPGVQMPLVLNIHGATGNAFNQEEITGMNAKADEEGFIVVNPQALGDPPIWYGPLIGPISEPDMDFFDALLDHLQREISIDPNRIFATGLSNGATMAYRLGCDMSDTFAAIAPVAGGHAGFHLCEIERPVSVLVIHGTDDHIVPYYGSGDDVAPTRAFVEAWVYRNGCTAEITETNPHANIQIETWETCQDGVEVSFYTLLEGGHTWPGAPLSVGFGSNFPYLDATNTIWEFFKAHPRSE